MTDVPSPTPIPTYQGAALALKAPLVIHRRSLHSSADGDPCLPEFRPLGGYLKRLFDVVIASVAIILLMPMMLMVVFLILITMGRPLLYAHERVGLGRRPFGCLKFRSMILDSDDALRRHFLVHPEAYQEWLETQKLRHDPRVTFVGRMIRMSSIDELPQLLNVLRGEMSCVGPRPVVSDELDRYGASASLYMSVRPGMTGLWQVSGRSSVEYGRRIALDVEYVRTWSFWLDLKILFKTMFVVAKVQDAA